MNSKHLLSDSNSFIVKRDYPLISRRYYDVTFEVFEGISSYAVAIVDNSIK